MLQFPRTGTVFCQSMIVGKLPKAEMHLSHGIWSRHNYRCEIPRWWKDLPVVGVKRDMLDLWASWYCSGVVVSSVLFEDYYSHINEIGGKVRYGEQCKGSGGFMKKYHNLMFADRNGNTDDVRFLDFANLNQEIYNLLVEYGHDDPAILTSSPENVGKNRDGRARKDIISPDLAKVIVKDEE